MNESYGMTEHSQMARNGDGSTILMLYMDNRGEEVGSTDEEQVYALWSYDAGLTWSAEELVKGGVDYGAPHAILTSTYGVAQIFPTLTNIGYTTRRPIVGWTNPPGSSPSIVPDYSRHPVRRLRK
jgi:hypothetical protein